MTFGLCKKTQLGYKDNVNFKTYNVTTGKETITIHILPNISRSKSNQAMKWVGEIVPRPFSKNSKLSISLVSLVSYLSSLKLYTVCFYCITIWGLCKAFLRNKKRSGTSFLPSFSADFWRKTFFLLYSINCNTRLSTCSIYMATPSIRISTRSTRRYYPSVFL